MPTPSTRPHRSLASRARRGALLLQLLSLLALAGCATPPPPAPSHLPDGVADGRARFAEVFCAVMEAGGESVPDHRPCAEALRDMPAAGASAAPRPVVLGRAQRPLLVALVPGIGYACFAGWLKSPDAMRDRLRAVGYDFALVPVGALSSSEANAIAVRDALLALPAPGAEGPNVVLVGYSKGAVDSLEALVRYPEIRSRVAAVVSLAGAVRGSPLADDATESQADLLRYWPGAKCDAGDDGVMESLRPSVRNAWLAANPLPTGLPYYSVVTMPDRDRVSWLLKTPWKRLARIDARNDGQVISSDQVIPGSTLLAYINADHWAAAVHIESSHPWLAGTLVSRNDYPREALLEAILRQVEEDLASTAAH